MKSQAVTVQIQPLVKASSSKQVKAKFFNMLGIDSASSSSMSHQYLDKDKNFNHPRDANIVMSVEKLKYKKDEELIPSKSMTHRWNLLQQKPERNLETEQSHKKREVVSFVDTVKVLPIPKRDEYSDRVAKRMWSSAVEIQEMAMRNSVEFAAEGWDWRTVTEDEQMYVCSETGELVHPVHFGNNYM